jgi:hypothetical protein
MRRCEKEPGNIKITPVNGDEIVKEASSKEIILTGDLKQI